MGGGDSKKQEKAQEDLSRQLTNMKQLLFGNESDQQSDIVLAQLSQEMYDTGLILALLRNLHRIDFEGKKDAVQIFNSILRRQIGTRTPTVEYICTKPDIIFTLCRGYEQQEIALNCGTMLRECIRYEALTKILLYSDNFYDFFKYVEVSTFDIASDAFATFKELLTKHKIWQLIFWKPILTKSLATIKSFCILTITSQEDSLLNCLENYYSTDTTFL